MNQQFAALLKKLLLNQQLKAIRTSLTLTLPLVMAGCAAVLIVNFPVDGYQDLMTAVFGDHWRHLSLHIVDGTFNILSIIIMLAIAASVAESYNNAAGNRETHPTVAALVSLACLIAVVQPYSLAPAAGDHPPPGQGIPFFWLGTNGLFVAILVAFSSTWVFFRLKRIPRLNISFYSEEADSSISSAFGALLPGMLTVILFALAKSVSRDFGIENIHQTFYDLLSAPFAKMGNTFPAALFYTFLRHFFWFFGIHGSNLLEPVAAAVYGPAMEENIAAVAQGLPAPHIFTKTFFDAFTAMGGIGATLCLIGAVFLANRRGSMYKISRLSLLPAAFNINEMIMFGLPVVLNPAFLIPFLLVPLVQCALTWLAMSWGLVPPAVHSIDWTAPPFIGGYAATGSLLGTVMQAVNLAVGALIYLPFVRIAETMKRETFNQAFRELMPGYAESIGNADYVVSAEAKALSLSLANDLAQAIDRNEISLEYQPQVESRTGRVFGVEALMRWDHSRLGRIPPGLFITLAEESDLIKRLGSWALEESCRQWDEWRRAGGADGVVMSVNVSVRQLDDAEIIGEIERRLRKFDIPKNMLEVEVTESAALGGGERSRLLRRIHDLGVMLAIDDFGMGHSSLVYLKHFPVDTIKIDRVLSKDVATSRSSSEIINTIAELCRTLGIHTIIEYVDNVEQLKALQSLDCTRIQGWLYSQSLPPEKCLEFIRKGAPVY